MENEFEHYLEQAEKAVAYLYKLAEDNGSGTLQLCIESTKHSITVLRKEFDKIK